VVSANAPLARRLPGFDARHATRRARRTRVAAGVLAVVGLTIFLVLFFDRSAPDRTVSRQRPSPPAAPHIASTLATWRLAAPISRSVVVPLAAADGRHLVIAGGTTTGGITASGIFALDVTDGSLTQLGDLRNALDGAGGAGIDGQVVIFGGTTASGAASSSVESLSASVPTAGTAPSVVPLATALGTLPQPRAAATVVTAGSAVFVVGGDDGSGPDPNVLTTTDGRHFSNLATLPVPVDFPAVTVFGEKLYVFGGVTPAAGGARHLEDTIQVVDLKTHSVTVAGHLPEPLTGAAAVVLGQHVLLAGGDTNAGTGSIGNGSEVTTSVAGSSTTSPEAVAPVSTVWSFNPSSDAWTVAGRLAAPVSHAGVAVLGSQAWLVGGESDGIPVATAQTLALASAAAVRPRGNGQG
jgi:N-acetylneuraminic acid mutarotase